MLPLLSWLSQYNIKRDIIGDIVSGCTVAVMHIPQGKFNVHINYCYYLWLHSMRRHFNKYLFTY